MSIVPGSSGKLIPEQSARLSDRESKSIIINTHSLIQHGYLRVIMGDKSYDFGNPQDESTLFAEIKINNVNTFKAILLGGEPAAGKSYIDQWWETNNLLNVLRIFIRNKDVLFSIDHGIGNISKFIERLLNYLNRNTRSGSKRNIKAHYDIGNDLYQLFLDKNMIYSSAYFSDDHQDIEAASETKLRMICEKLKLTAQDHVIEIGTGWGGFAIYAAQNYGCRVTTTTISDEQFEYTNSRIKELQLDSRITLLNKDYRALTGSFDKLVSIEMIEAVGHKYLDTYFKTCSNLLKPNGAMLIQAITMSDRFYDDYLRSQDFIRKYVFPGGCLPSMSSIISSTSKHTDLDLHQTQSFAASYAKTLDIWFERFIKQRNKILELGYPQTLTRLWEYYMKYCQAGFEAKVIDVHQLVFRKPDNRLSEF